MAWSGYLIRLGATGYLYTWGSVVGCLLACVVLEFWVSPCYRLPPCGAPGSYSVRGCEEELVLRVHLVGMTLPGALVLHCSSAPLSPTQRNIQACAGMPGLVLALGLKLMSLAFLLQLLCLRIACWIPSLLITKTGIPLTLYMDLRPDDWQ